MARTITDSDVVNAIALMLGTAESWDGADMLEAIADVIGRVRWHPGADGHPNGYVAHIDRKHGGPIARDPFLSQYVADIDDDESARECSHCGAAGHHAGE